jgi:hypothetical protein
MAAAGCSSQARSPVPTQSEVLSRLTTAYVDYARCARQHGLPNLPDPQVDQNGNDQYPAGSVPGGGWPQSVIQGCRSAWATVLQWRDQLDAMRIGARRAPTAADRQRSLQFARCIRAHGFPDYPDPGGPSTPPPGFDKQNLSAKASAAIRACSAAPS